MAASKGTLMAIPELYGFTLYGEVEGYESVESDSDSGSTSSIISAVFVVGGDSGRKGNDKEDIDDGSDDG